jgi:ADP-ribose pyrophosphatase
VAHAPDWVNVVALTPDGNLVLVRQFRFGTNELSLEVPGGVIEAGEDPVAAGVQGALGGDRIRRREGQAPRQRAPQPAIMDNRCHVVLRRRRGADGPDGLGRRRGDRGLDGPAAEVLAWARSGAITHSLSVAALMLFEGARRV